MHTLRALTRLSISPALFRAALLPAALLTPALLPPALAQSAPEGAGPAVYLAPAGVTSSAEVRLVAACPGARALLLDRTGRTPVSSAVPRPAGRVVSGAAVGPDGAATFALPAAAFDARACLAVVVAGPRGVQVAGTLQLPGAPPLVPRVNTGPTREVLVTEFMKNPTAVADVRGEWIEIVNLSGRPLDLEGWVLSDEGNDSTVLDNGGAGLIVQPYRYLVLGREADPALNGGVVVDGVYSGVTLSNGADEIVLSRPDGFVADVVRYGGGAAWPNVPGASVSLSPRAWLTWLDDRPAAWCPGETALSGGDLGTPGGFNDTCGD